MFVFYADIFERVFVVRGDEVDSFKTRVPFTVQTFPIQFQVNKVPKNLSTVEKKILLLSDDN